MYIVGVMELGWAVSSLRGAPAIKARPEHRVGRGAASASRQGRGR